MGVDLIDFTALQKRGLLKRDLDNSISDSPEVIDFTSNSNSNLNSGNVESAPNPLAGFFDASSVSQNQGNGSFGPGFSTALNDVSNSSSSDFNAFKIKLDDFEYKLQNLIDKFEQIEIRLKDFERSTVRSS